MINKEKLHELQNLLTSSSLEELDKKKVLFFIESFRNKLHSQMLSRSYIFYGSPGTGKTFLAEKLLEVLDLEMIYCASSELPFGKRYFSFKEIALELKHGASQIIYIDDLNYLFKRDDNCNILPEDARDFLTILDTIQKDSSKYFLATINDLSDLDERMLDRIGVKIDVDLPSVQQKQNFFAARFQDSLPPELNKYLSLNSLGYNYRDLMELVRIAYCLGQGKISKNSLQDALHQYLPANLQGFNIENGLGFNLNDIIGKEEQVKISRRLVKLYQKPELRQKMGFNRANLLIFYGPPGTGKTFFVKALAGEMGFPIINAKSANLSHGRVHRVINLAMRYNNCIIFIDEAEKLFGNQPQAEDENFIGELNAALDGVGNKKIQSVIILAVNDLTRFGAALQDRFIPVEFGLPSHPERQTFYEHKLQGTGLTFNLDHLAKITKGMSFREMERAWNELMFDYLDNPQEIDCERMSRTINWLGNSGINIFG